MTLDTTVDSTLDISPLRAEDRAGWEPLARGYKAFYNTEVDDAGYEAAWQRLLADGEVHSLAARQGGQLLGIAHWMRHTSLWSADAVYLQDLFVAEAARGQGVAAALIERLAALSRELNAPRLYWLTHQDNTRARALYDRVAKWHGFLRYDAVL